METDWDALLRISAPRAVYFHAPEAEDQRGQNRDREATEVNLRLQVQLLERIHARSHFLLGLTERLGRRLLRGSVLILRGFASALRGRSTLVRFRLGAHGFALEFFGVCTAPRALQSLLCGYLFFGCPGMCQSQSS
jgi:hypothetical protein